jgi:hypothetical protein
MPSKEEKQYVVCWFNETTGASGKSESPTTKSNAMSWATALNNEYNGKNGKAVIIHWITNIHYMT